MERHHADRGGARILIADDDSTMRVITRAVLEQEGHIVEEAADGDEACRLFEELRPDLVLMDINMPVMDGLRACEQMRRQPELGGVPILLVTGMDDSDAIAQAYAVGATDFEQKPVNWTVLGHRVRYMLRAKWAADDLRQSEAKNNALLNAIPDMMFQLDSEGMFVDFRQGGSTTPALPPEEFLGRRLSDVLPSDVATLCEHFTHRALTTSKIQVFEYQLDTHGDPRDFEARVVASGPNRALGIVRDITDRKRSESELQFHAYHDQLTKLPNRLLFREYVAKTLEHARQHNDSFAIVFVGLDRFKQVNDTFGHGLGDLVLKHTAMQLTNTLQAEDRILKSRSRDDCTMVARFGGDEFTILIPALSDHEVLDKVIDRVVEAIAHPFDLDGQEVSLAASTGASVYPADGEDADTLLTNADAALRSAKRAGRNSHRVYKPAMNADAQEILSLETQLRQALKRQEFQPFFQPKVDAATGRIRGAEALIRWQHPSRGLLAPADFLSRIEEMGLSTQVGNQMMQLVCSQVVEWLRSTGRTVPVAMNLSDEEFRQKNLLEKIQRAATNHRFDPCNLEVEITEGVIVRDRTAARKLLSGLRELGVRSAIDDFGTGNSSLSILKGLPIDTLKIDRSFISDLATEPESSAITATIVHMGHDLGMTVVAEGVETPEQLEILKTMGCDQIQGFLFSKPVRGEEFTTLLLDEPCEEPDDGELQREEPVAVHANVK